MSFELVLFLALAGLAVLFAVGMLLSENAVHSALFLIGNFGCVAVLYLMLNAPFIGMVQIAVYAGAIMVLFLFVIMLLGAEQTTDTTRRFRWLTGAATVLAASFFVAIVAPLVIGGVNLPKPPPGDPSLRLVHAAGLPNDVPVTVTLSGPTLPEPVVVENVRYGDVSAFMTLPAGDYSLLVQDVEGGPVMPPAQVTLSGGELATAIVYGELNIDDGQLPSLALVPQDVTAGAEGRTRLLVFNGYHSSSVSLVDLGPNRTLDLRRREQFDEAGQPLLDEFGNTVLVDTIADTVIASDLGFGEVPVPVSFPAGTYSLAVVDENNTVVATWFDHEFTRDTEELILFVADYLEFLGNDAAYRPYFFSSEALPLTMAAAYGSPSRVGQLLFIDYLLPVNVVGMLLLVALVGVVVLTRPDAEKQDRRVVRRRKVSRPLTSVISTQTGGEVTEPAPQLPSPQSD
jgi:NADH-quinone oxidoreductase subunit J